MVRLVSMTDEEYGQFIAWAVPDYAQEQVKSGAWRPEEAVERSEKLFDALLPDGLSTPGQFLCVIQAEGNVPVGRLWYGVHEDGASRSAALYDLVIFEEYRRRGYASQALSVLEDRAREQGMQQIILHVFGHNSSARALYRKSGYVERNVTMVKELG